MPHKPKYDRNALFLEYLTSDEDIVIEFLKRNGAVARQTKGLSGAMTKATLRRFDKKQAFKERAMKKAVTQLENQVAEKVYKPSIKELGDMHQRIMALGKLALNEMSTMEGGKLKLNPKYSKIISLKEIREITKVEKKEPTKYIEDLTPPQEDSLSDRQKDILEKRRKEKKK